MQHAESGSAPFVIATLAAILATLLLFAFAAAAEGLEVHTSYLQLQFASPDTRNMDAMPGLVNPFGEGFELSFHNGPSD